MLDAEGLSAVADSFVSVEVRQGLGGFADRGDQIGWGEGDGGAGLGEYGSGGFGAVFQVGLDDPPAGEIGWEWRAGGAEAAEGLIIDAEDHRVRGAGGFEGLLGLMPVGGEVEVGWAREGHLRQRG